MKKNNKRVCVIGDNLLEVYLDTNTFRLGGAGNIYEHLKQYKFDQLTTYKNTNLKTLPLRIWQYNQVIYKKDVFQGYLDIEDSSEIDFIFETSSNIWYIEDHFESSYSGNIIFDSYIKKYLSEIENITLYLDSRNPALIPIEFLQLPFKMIYWKMNDIEYQQYLKSSLSKETIHNLAIINTHGSKGSTLDIAVATHCYTINVKPSGLDTVQACGCGDSFFTMFLVANELFELSFRDSLKLASIAGGIAASQANVVTVTPNQIKDFIKNTDNEYFQKDHLLLALENY